ncbi:hypothetical protein ABQE73_07135, partial [Xanthomonas campestris pv. campestris]|uniref:hypothetical protein n=1 Tax=Xanthomonas campestris TaxID=339 RepID=UPI001E50736A
GSSGTPLQTSRPCGRWVIGGFSGATRLLLEDYRYKHAIGGSHYFMISKGSLHPDVLKVVGSSLNLNFIQYENSAGDHKNFGVALNDLVTKVNLARN